MRYSAKDTFGIAVRTVTGLVMLALVFAACSGNKKNQPVAESEVDEAALVGPAFSEDSAFIYCARQCAFGPRTMNSNAHDHCEDWIVRMFEQYGCVVERQKTKVEGWDGTMLRATNIIARSNPSAAERIIICAHWDSRPWADNDPDENNWHTPVMAANDGASGVAVMLELARCINAAAEKPAIGVDFVCFDAEDYGAPEWSGLNDTEDTWALGAQFFAANLPESPKGDGVTKYSCGILLDMVGGQGAHFYHEGLSRHYAGDVLDKVWQAASTAGYASLFVNQNGGSVLDDHKPLNEAGIPTVDIIAYYPDCRQSSFGPTWHTVSDDMEHIDRNTLKAVGQTLVQFLYSF